MNLFSCARGALENVDIVRNSVCATHENIDALFGRLRQILKKRISKAIEELITFIRECFGGDVSPPQVPRELERHSCVTGPALLVILRDTKHLRRYQGEFFNTTVFIVSELVTQTFLCVVLSSPSLS